MKKEYEFLEHSADIKIRASARNFPCALKQLFYALREFLTSKKRVKVNKTKKVIIKEKGETLEELTFNFFSSLLSESEIKQMLPVELKILKYEKNLPQLKAKVYFSDEIKQRDQVKAVTYHELKVEQTPNKTTIIIIFDV